MKNLILGLCILIVAVATSGVNATAEGIEILSQNYHIWGSYDEKVYGGGIMLHEFKDGYDVTDTAPISRTVSVSQYVQAASNADLFKTYISADAAYANVAFSNAHVDATWTFRPLTSSIGVSVRWWENYWNSQYAGTTVSVTDLTTGLELASSYSPFWDTYSPLNEWNDAMPFLALSVNPNDLYSIRVVSKTDADADGGWFSDITVNVTPEPATLLFLGLGAAMLRRENNK